MISSDTTTFLAGNGHVWSFGSFICQLGFIFEGWVKKSFWPEAVWGSLALNKVDMSFYVPYIEKAINDVIKEKSYMY